MKKRELVYYPDPRHGFQRVGKLLVRGRKWAKILDLSNGKTHKVAVTDVSEVAHEEAR